MSHYLIFDRIVWFILLPLIISILGAFLKDWIQKWFENKP